MSKDIFLFDGGSYKQSLAGSSRPHDSGRIRTWLSEAEAQHVMRDPHIPGHDFPLAHGHRLDTKTYPEIFKNLEVDDRIYVHLIPGHSRCTSFWAGSDVGLEGFKAKFDTVDVAEVACAMEEEGTAEDVGGLSTAIEHDFSVGLGHAIKDALQKAEEDCKYGTENDFDPKWKKYRNTDSPTFEELADPLLIQMGAAYIRMTITGVPEADPECNSCGDHDGWPRIYFGLLCAATCMPMNELLPFCVTEGIICAGCDDPCTTGCAGETTEETTE